MALSKEPVLILNGILTALNAVQLAAIKLPDWAHALIAAASVLIGSVLARSKVTPKHAAAAQVAAKKAAPKKKAKAAKP